MIIDDINISALRTFVLITELGSLTKVADYIGCSRSHVSRQLSDLEKQLNVTLMLRSTRQFVLTDAGKLLFNACQNTFATTEQALLECINNQDTPSGHIRINCVGGIIGEDIISPILATFLRNHPDITIELDFSSHRVDLIADEFDLAIRMGYLEDADLIARHITTLNMVTVASPNYLKQHALLTHPNQLKMHSCLVGSVKKWGFRHKVDNNEFTMNIGGSMQCKNGRVLLHHGIQGQGIIRIPEVYCQEELDSNVLSHVFKEWEVPSVPLSLLYHRDKYQPKRLIILIDTLLNDLKEAFKKDSHH
ncbi:LysR family transcriptional regulator [Vibrio sp.]|nr:LysR family transcriptional regulator [Vibrio sp.]